MERVKSGSKTDRNRSPYLMTILVIFWYSLTSINVMFSKIICSSGNFSLEVAVITILLMQYLAAGIPFMLTKTQRKSSTDNNLFLSFERQDFLVGFFYLLGNMGALMSLTSTSVSLNQVLKALEPMFSAVLSATIFKTYLSSNQVIHMLIAVSGACICAFNDLQFNWFAASTAFVSNIAFASRNVFLKLSTQNQLSPFEQQGKVSLCAAVFLIPHWTILCMVRANEISQIFHDFSLVKYLLAVSLSHAAYNFCSISVLSKVENAVEHALVKIMKRPFTIFATSVLDWNESRMTPTNTFGIFVLILGQILFKANFSFASLPRPTSGGLKVPVMKLLALLVLFLAPFLFYLDPVAVLHNQKSMSSRANSLRPKAFNNWLVSCPNFEFLKIF